MHVGIVSLFPALLQAFADTSVVGRAIEAGLLRLHVEDLRPHGVGRYKSVDDTPYGGGSGMVLRVEAPYYVPGETGLNVKETVLVTRSGATALNRSNRGLVVLD